MKSSTPKSSSSPTPSKQSRSSASRPDQYWRAKIQNTWQTKPPLRWTAYSVAGLILVAIIGIGGYAWHYKGKIYPNVALANTSYGGQTAKQAKAGLEKTVAALPQTVSIAVPNQPTVSLATKDLGLTYDIPATVQLLYAQGRAGSIPTRTINLFLYRLHPHRVSAVYTIDQHKTNDALQKMLDKTNVKPKDAQIVLGDDATLTVKPGEPGEGLTIDQARSAVSQELGAFHTSITLKPTTLAPAITENETALALQQVKTILAKAPVTFVAGDTQSTVDTKQLFSWIHYTISSEKPAAERPSSYLFAWLPTARADDASPLLVASLDPAKVKAYIATLSAGVDKDMQNAQIRMDNNQLTVVSPETDGRKLQVDDAVTATIKQLSSSDVTPNTTITLPVQTINADIRAETITNLGIKELIGTATTDFHGSPSNRVHNITNGASLLNGKLVPPGQEFSTIKTLGKIDDTTGYLPELVIKEDRTVPEYGGGLCQVSTTLFRSVLNAGLKVTERQNHSYRVSYYEPPVGLDATIYMPQPDFRFFNDTPGYILIQNKIEGTKITFELYGTKDGRTSTVSDPVVSNVIQPPAPIYENTDTLPKGQTKQVEHAHPGSTAVATYSVMRDGKEIIHQVFKSKYKPWPARFLVGTGGASPAPSPTASSSPSPSPTH